MMLSSQITFRLCIYGTLMVCVLGEPVEPLTSVLPLRTMTEAQTRLPCRYDGADKVVQIEWSRMKADGSEEQIIMYHFTEGVKEFTQFVNKVRFEALEPTKDATLLIMSAEESDEATYSCKMALYPSGKSDSKIQLTVWTRPISILEPVVLVEGQSFQPAAICRSVGRPQPRLTWDTDLPGQAQNRSVDTRTVSSQFSLHPLRSLNGRRLDCLVWHPLFSAPFRIANNLQVHYPPDVSITGFNNWQTGLEGAELKCESKGNPQPTNFTWSRKGGALPEEVELTPEGTLKFGRPLSQSDSGIYKCTASNSVGSARAEKEIVVEDLVPKVAAVDNLLMIIIGSVAGVLVLILVIVVIAVNRYHKRKNKRLSQELHEKREEISTLSRQASFRRMNSVSTDHRYTVDELMPLRVEGTLRNSLSSLDRRSRDSRSTLGGGGLDTLGRPIIYNTSRRGRESRMSREEREREREREESRHRVESYVRDSSASLFHPPLHPSPIIMDQTAEIVKPMNGSAIPPSEGKPRLAAGARGSRNHVPSPIVSTYPPLTDEDEEDEEEVRRLGLEDGRSDFLNGPAETNGFDHHGSETNSSLRSETMSSPYEQCNGSLRVSSRPNGSQLPPPMPLLSRSQIV